MLIHYQEGLKRWPFNLCKWPAHPSTRPHAAQRPRANYREGLGRLLMARGRARHTAQLLVRLSGCRPHPPRPDDRGLQLVGDRSELPAGGHEEDLMAITERDCIRVDAPPR